VGVLGLFLTLSGTPAGGTLTFGQGGALDLGEPRPGQEGITAKVTVNTHATDSIQGVVARLNEAINAKGSPFVPFIESTVDDNNSDTLVLGGWPLSAALPFLSTTDAGLDVEPGVLGFSAVYDEANDKADLAWSIPTGASYDSIEIARNQQIVVELPGSATSYTHTTPLAYPQNGFSEDALKEAYPELTRGFLQYQIIGVTAGRPSDMATVVVQKPVWIIPIKLPDGRVGVPYRATMSAVGGLTLPVTWSLPPGELPPGLSLDGSSGTVSGTPTQAGDYALGVRARDSHTPEPSAHYKIINLKIAE
jgi:hypothetical protein